MNPEDGSIGFVAYPECDLEGCEEQSRGFYRPYCCDSHANAGLRHAFEAVKALEEGRELPEPPTAEEVDRRAERADRWSPEKMQERIDEFRGGEW